MLEMPPRFRVTLSAFVLLWTTISAGSTLAGESLRVWPDRLELKGSSEPQHLLAVIVRDGNGSQDVTTAATWTSTQPEVVRVTTAGVVEAVAVGEAELVAEWQGQSARIPVVVGSVDLPRPPSFLHDVQHVLTRYGCNQGACHGKLAGQAGFRLSLRGYAPEWDYEWLTREYEGRRLNRLDPAESLILKKATGRIAHLGGKLFSADSRAYRVLVDWIAAGTPAVDAAEPKIAALEVLPGTLTLQVGQPQALIVRAKYADGRVRDVTWLAKFASNDESMISVTPTGIVTAIRAGEASVRAHFNDLAAVAIFTAPFSTPVPAERFAAPANAVDEAVFAKLATLRIPPAELCGDEVFLRRLYLDLMGILPQPAEVQAFLADTRADKRAQWIEAALNRPEFVDYWTLQWCDLLQNRKERDHDVRGPKGVRAFHAWLREQVAANRPWDELARTILTSHGKVTENPAVGYYIVTVGEHREAEKSEVTSAVAQAFLGTRIGCAKCHNHPLERYTQDDYYHFAAFFSRIKFDRKQPKEGDTKLTVSAPDPNQNKQPVAARQPRTGMMMRPQPLDRREMEVATDEDPRAKLAAWMTDPTNESFSGALVNRVWKHFLGVGLVEPVDDLRASNPPTNPELWKLLNHEFVSHRYDLKHLMRLIVNSRTYQLASRTEPANENDTRFYSHYYARRLPAEVLLDAISNVTGVPDHFRGYPLGLRAVQLADPNLDSYFLALFGRSPRVTACACERSGEVTISQLLHLQNGDWIGQKIGNPEGRLGQLLTAAKSDAEVLDELFLIALGRRPTEAERAAVSDLISAGDPRAEVYRDLVWALVNSKEFTFNH